MKLKKYPPGGRTEDSFLLTQVVPYFAESPYPVASKVSAPPAPSKGLRCKRRAGRRGAPVKRFKFWVGSDLCRGVSEN